MYEIRLAGQSDKQALINFIDNHWKKEHIFVQCESLFDWQHYDDENNAYNFIIGVHSKSKEIHGVLGFVTLSQFDSKIPSERLCWMAIWKVRDDARGHRLGRRLMDELENTVNPDIISTVGASDMTLPMYQAKGYNVGVMQHYFILNTEKSTHYLLDVADYKESDNHVTHDMEKQLVCATEEDILNKINDCFKRQVAIPKKTPGYLLGRYTNHPIYQYDVYLIQQHEENLGVIVTRVCSHQGHKAIRVVDFIGPSDALKGLNNQWKVLLRNHDAEYLDFYNAGINHHDLISSGFALKDESKGHVIPNYFEPFAKHNVDISYMISSAPGTNFRIVKGDSDQDRPNLLGGHDE